LGGTGNMFWSGSKTSLKGYPIRIRHLKSCEGVFNIRPS
jgi:hypothetical protein